MFKPVDYRQIEDFKGDIAALANRYNDSELFQKVFDACKKKLAFLFVGNPGFMVLQAKPDKTLLVWVAVAKSKYNRAEIFYWLDNFSRETHSEKIEIQSPRKGWKKILPSFGFDLISENPNCIWQKLVS